MNKSSTQLPRKIAIWDPAALNDPKGRLAEKLLSRENIVWDCIQIRDRQNVSQADVYHQIADLAHERSVAVWINRRPDLVKTLHATGLVWGHENLMPFEPSEALSVVSIHSLEDARIAADLHCDALVLGNIKQTPSKVGKPGLGWNAFEELAAAQSLPMYAVGGLSLTDEQTALESGACGIAAIRAPFVF